MPTPPALAAQPPSAPTAAPRALPLPLGDWQGSSQDLRAGLFMQELAAEAWPAQVPAGARH